jgi:hypothetical protein
MRLDQNKGPNRTRWQNSRVAQAALIILVIVAVSSVLWQAQSRDVGEPVFEGKALSAWLQNYFDNDNVWSCGQQQLRIERTDLAIRELGTNAVPLLVTMVKNHEVRMSAAFSLWAIDKEIAAKAGVDVFRGKYGE